MFDVLTPQTPWDFDLELMSQSRTFSFVTELTNIHNSNWKPLRYAEVYEDLKPQGLGAAQVLAALAPAFISSGSGS